MYIERATSQLPCLCHAATSRHVGLSHGHVTHQHLLHYRPHSPQYPWTRYGDAQLAGLVFGYVCADGGCFPRVRRPIDSEAMERERGGHRCLRCAAAVLVFYIFCLRLLVSFYFFKKCLRYVSL